MNCHIHFQFHSDRICVVCDRLTPIASANWLQSNLAGVETAGASASLRREEEEEEGGGGDDDVAYCGGLDLTAPASWREHERRRLDAVAALAAADSTTSDDMFVSGSVTSQVRLRH